MSQRVPSVAPDGGTGVVRRSRPADLRIGDVVHHGPGDRHTRASRARRRVFAAKQYKEAIVEYRGAVQQDPQSGEARYKLAEAYVRDNDPAGAYREYVRAADLMPANLEAQLKAGQMLLLARQFEDARARADQVLATDSRNVQALLLRGSALAGLKDLDSAITQIEEAITLDPDRSGTYDHLGALQLAKGDPNRAEEAFRKAVQLDGTSVSARLTLAIFYLATRRAAEAEDALERTLEIDESNLTANRALAALYLASNRAAEAEPYLKTVAGQSTNVEARLVLADYYRMMNRPNEAVRILSAVGTDHAEAFAAAQARLAAMEFAGGQTKDAHKRLDDLLSRQPRFAPGLVLKARFLLSEHRLDDALGQARAATQADPTSAHAQFLLGKVYTATGRPDDAAKAFREVLRLNPRAAAAQLELARVQTGRWTRRRIGRVRPSGAEESARQSRRSPAPGASASSRVASWRRRRAN